MTHEEELKGPKLRGWKNTAPTFKHLKSYIMWKGNWIFSVWFWKAALGSKDGNSKGVDIGLIEIGFLKIKWAALWGCELPIIVGIQAEVLSLLIKDIVEKFILRYYNRTKWSFSILSSVIMWKWCQTPVILICKKLTCVEYLLCARHLLDTFPTISHLILRNPL